jgi:hypothetical protein
LPWRGGGGGRRLRSIVFGDALLEALDALGNIAHQFRNLATTEQQQHDDQNDQPVPHAKRTHYANSLL